MFGKGFHGFERYVFCKSNFYKRYFFIKIRNKFLLARIFIPEICKGLLGCGMMLCLTLKTHKNIQ